ncbi:MAG: pyridoxamine 5'-phosphate oxidase [Gemmatimonadales bacterium]|nr:MAG: pyridoxamine 5'-phosphate oxidase [Gemmatimonadales bacterium]
MTEFPPPSGPDDIPEPAPQAAPRSAPGAAPAGALGPNALEAAAPRPPLTPDALGDDPVAAALAWVAEAAEQSGMRYPNAVTLATVDAEGRPDARIVLLKGGDERGFLFFTNYRSAKARVLEASPNAALVFYWDAMGRQVRVRGRTERLPADESDAYFESRPRGSRVGAWASEQSMPIGDRDALEARYHEVEAEFADTEVPRPAHWGGYLLRPVDVEFWSEGTWRLHDRIRFRRSTPGDDWITERLQP